MSYGPSYELNQTPTRSPQRSGKWLERFFLLAFVVCLLGGVLGLAALWALRQNAAPPVVADPLHALAVEDILPELALRQLTGDPGDALAVQALQAGQLETARAILTYATDPPAMQRAEHLAQLARSLRGGRAAGGGGPDLPADRSGCTAELGYLCPGPHATAHRRGCWTGRGRKSHARPARLSARHNWRRLRPPSCCRPSGARSSPSCGSSPSNWATHL